MVTQVKFLLLESDSQLITTAVKSLAQLYIGYERVLVLAENQQYLERLDELLWHQSSEQFIAYSQETECYSPSAPVLLTTEQPLRIRYQSLLNISGKMPTNPEQFKSIIELVNVEETARENARDRYKHYRKLGFTVNHREVQNS